MKLWITYWFLGAFWFCIPGLILTAILRHELSEWLYTIPAFISVFCAYFVVSRSKNRVAAGPSVAMCMLLGIHILGAWFVMLELTFLGGGFRAVNSLHGREFLSFLEIPLLLSLPLVSWIMMPQYFFALCFVTVFLIFAHFRWERGRWIFPSSSHGKAQLNAPSP
jgi:hypothetical protein